MPIARDDAGLLTELPAVGIDPAEVRDQLGAAAADDMAWRGGRGWSLVYDLEGEHEKLLGDALSNFTAANGLSASAFPSAARFESAVVAMVAATVSPTRPAFGTFTTGGTESILVALKAYRDHPDFTGDELVLPATAHPAFGKAAHYLGLRTTAVPVNDDGTVDPPAVLGAISDSTLVIGLSAPNFPFGTVDPITDIAPVAQARGVGVHVDAAVGGLFLPFVDDAPPFALDVDGVTSVSVDVHKYGYGAKGASVLLFATQQLRRASYYVDADWAGGAYAASAVVGTRPVGPAAAAYAAMVHLGRDGYRRLVGEVLDTAARLQRGLADATTLHVIGRPPTGVFAMTGEAPIVRRLALGLRRRGWLADALASPPALHFVATPRHAAAVDAFIRDAAAALDDPDDGDAPLASYGVMVRGAVDEKSLHAALDRRYDGTGAS